MPKRILVVDDEVPIADLLSQALADEGYETHKVVQSLRVYDAVREHQPDLILLDLMMPYLNGQDELRLISMDPESKRRIPVIVVTAMVDAKREEETLRQYGVTDIVLKPFDLNALVRLVKRTIGESDQEGLS
ncbi:MAG TPA: response regulator [Ktedonobacterales bacterium]|jgi:CheY-like chemotaxis protein